MKYCDLCGTSVNGSDRFCPICGSPIEIERDEITNDKWAASNKKPLKRIDIKRITPYRKRIICVLISILAVYLFGGMITLCIYPSKVVKQWLKSESFIMTDEYVKYGHRRFALIMENKETGRCFEISSIDIEAEKNIQDYGHLYDYWLLHLNPEGEMDPEWMLSSSYIKPINYNDIYCNPDGYSLDEIDCIDIIDIRMRDDSLKRFSEKYSSEDGYDVKLEIGVPSGSLDVKYKTLRDYIDSYEQENLLGHENEYLNNIVSNSGFAHYILQWPELKKTIDYKENYALRERTSASYGYIYRYETTSDHIFRNLYGWLPLYPVKIQCNTFQGYINDYMNNGYNSEWKVYWLYVDGDPAEHIENTIRIDENVYAEIETLTDIHYPDLAISYIVSVPDGYGSERYSYKIISVPVRNYFTGEEEYFFTYESIPESNPDKNLYDVYYAYYHMNKVN